MVEETFRQMLRKKIVDMKPGEQDFYTETYNLVSTLIKLNPDAFEKEIAQLLDNKLETMYTKPGPNSGLTLSQMEKLYQDHKLDPSFRFRRKSDLDLTDIKTILDKVRRDLLFFLALVEDRPNNYGIVLKEAVSEGKGAMGKNDADTE